MSFRGAPTTVGERIAAIEEELRRLKRFAGMPIPSTASGHQILSRQHIDTAFDAPKTDGDVLTWDQGAGVWRPEALLAGPLSLIGAKVIHTVVESVPNNDSNFAKDFPAIDRDTYGFWDAGASTRLTVPAGLGGDYLAVATDGFQPNATGYRTMAFRLNGGAARPGFQSSPAVNGNSTSFGCMEVFIGLAETEYLEVMLRHTAGVALDSIAVGSFTLIRLGVG